MAARLQLRRGTSASPSLTDGEIFLNYTTGTIQFASGSNGNALTSSLLPLDKSVSGNIILDGNITATNLTITGNALVQGNITFGGSLITLGDENTDNIVFTGELSSSLIPNDDNSFDIGSSDKRYRHIHAVSASIDDLSVGGSGILSSSVQNFETFSSSVDSRLENLNSYTESTDQRLSSIETFTQSVDSRVSDLEFFSSSEYQTDSSSFDSRLDTLNLYTQSNDQRVNLLEVFTQSADLRLIDLESTSSDQEPRIDSLEASQSFFDNTFSSSVDGRLDSLEIFSESLDAEFLNTNGDNVVSSSIQIDIEQTTNYTTFSSSLYSTDSGLDSRLNNLNLYTQSNDIRIDGIDLFTGSQETKNSTLGTYTSSVEQRINSIHSYTSSLKSAIDVSGTGTGSITTILGDLLVQGATTTINTNDLVIKDKLVAIASGSIDSSTSDGAGFFISGANSSILWNHSTQTLDFNTKVSSSIGFKGDGSELENVTAAIVDFNNITDKPTLVSGSSQISFNGITDKPSLVSGSSQINISGSSDYTESIKTRLNSEGVISGSSQVDADTITNFDSNVRDLFVEDIVHTGSFLGTATTRDLTEGAENFYYTDERVKTKLNFEEVISGSSQVQIDSVDGFTPFSSSVDSRLDNLNSYTQSTDTRLFDLESTSSNQEDRIDSLELDTHTHTNKSQLDTIDQNLSNSDSPTFSSLTLTNLTNEPISSQLLQGVLYSSTGELVYSDFGDAIYYNVTQSADVVLISSSISNDSNDNILTAGAVKKYVDWRTEEILDAIGAADITAVIAGDGISGGGLVGDVTMSLNTSSLHFTNGVVSSLPNGIISGSTFTTFSSSFNSYTQSTDLRLNDLENFSSSLDDDFVTQTELTSATSSLINSINEKLNSSSFNSYTQSTDLRLNDLESFSSSIDTTIKTELNTNDVISGSTGDQLTGSFDSRYLNTNGDNVVSGSSQITISDTTGYTTFSSSIDTRIITQESFSSSIDTTIKSKLSSEGVISGSSQLTTEFDSRYLNTNGDNVVSGSSQISFNGIIDKPALVSGSDQLTGSLVDLVSDQSIGGTKTFNNIVVNGTGSFSFIQSTTGSSTSIGEAFIVLNENTPSSNFAGIKVVDSGSTFTTASFIYDGQNNQWLFQHEGSENSGSSLAIFGPLSQDGLGTEVGLTENKIPKALTDHGHHIGDSNITDTGTLITLGSNSVVTGTFYATGTTLVSGSAQVTSLLPSGVVSGSSQVNADTITNFDTNVKAKLNTDTVVSGSSQINHDSTTGFVANEHIDHSTVSITAGDGLTGGGNITTSRTINVVGTTNRISVSADAVDISTAYIGQTSITTLGTITTGTWNGSVIGSAFLDADTAHLSGTQTFSGDKTFSSVVNITNSTASTTSTTGALKVTGGVGIGGTLNVGGDVVAFSSSDRRLKDEITPIPNSLQKINSIGGYSFVWNEKQDIYNGKDYGVIAQEIEEILPELVETRENGYKAVKYDRLVSLLIEGIKELTQEVAELKRKLED